MLRSLIATLSNGFRALTYGVLMLLVVFRITQ